MKIKIANTINHGVVNVGDLPMPFDMVLNASAIVVVITFVYLKISWKESIIVPSKENFEDSQNIIGKIVQRFEDADLKVVAMKMIHLSDEDAKGFYKEHEGKPFFNPLVEFMTSGPVVVQVLKGENAILKNRELMGNTNPQEAEPGTIRSDFAQSIDANAVHGSDSVESAKREIAYFFNDSEIF